MFRRYTWQIAYIIVRLDPSTPLHPFHYSPPLCIAPSPYLVDSEVNGELALAAVDLADPWSRDPRPSGTQTCRSAAHTRCSQCSGHSAHCSICLPAVRLPFLGDLIGHRPINRLSQLHNRC